VINYQVPSSGDVSIVVYNVMGQVVKVLYQGQREQGRYSASWDGTDNNGNQVSSGIYLYRINAGDYTASRKMVLVK
jgi:flagellar hook assembly protein FlgD